MLKRMQYSLNYSGTRFLSTDNENYSIFLALNFKNLAITTFSPKLVVDRTTATTFSRQNDVGSCARTT